jgi:diguanylate cyclase (GGDEF)-like protein
LSQLEKAFHDHQQWYQEINRSLACHTPYKQEEVHENSHYLCEFGKWYYDPSNQLLHQYDGFKSIEEQHTLMHSLAAELLVSSFENSHVDVKKYDVFTNIVANLRMQINSLRRELQNEVFNQDSLTGARVRSGMLTDLRQQHGLVKRRALNCCIAMMDIDHFKRVNDQFGHQSGDRVLKNIISLLLSQVREYDVIYRYGGEEFLLCLPGTDLITTFSLIERLREAVETIAFTEENMPKQITVSFGMTELASDCYVEESINRADKALYHAKSLGRNQTSVWENIDFS